MPSVPDTVKRIASKLPGVTAGIACKGTSVESTTYNVRKKAFVFVRETDAGHEVRLKIRGSWTKLVDPSAAELAKAIPESYAAFAPARKK